MEKVLLKHVEKLDYSVVEELIRQTVGDRKYGKVIIKPNFCFHQRIPGATTSPDLIRFLTRFFGLKIRKATRKILGMEKID